jgi:hypothetical protein
MSDERSTKQEEEWKMAERKMVFLATDETRIEHGTRIRVLGHPVSRVNVQSVAKVHFPCVSFSPSAGGFPVKRPGDAPHPPPARDAQPSAKPRAEAIARKGVPATGPMRPTAAKTQGRGASRYAAKIAGQNMLAQFRQRLLPARHCRNRAAVVSGWRRAGQRPRPRTAQRGPSTNLT